MFRKTVKKRTLAAATAARKGSAFTYTAASGRWSTDTLTAKSSPYTEATATIK